MEDKNKNLSIRTISSANLPSGEHMVDALKKVRELPHSPRSVEPEEALKSQEPRSSLEMPSGDDLVNAMKAKE